MDIGGKIRACREERNMTARELAEIIGCTPSFISQLERNLANPSINTLKEISKTLGVPLVYFFEEDTDVKDEKDFIVRQDVRRKLKSVGEQAEVHLLSPTHLSKNIELHLLVIEPGGGSERMYTNQAEEVGYVLEGTLTLLLGNEEFTVHKGDGIYFPGSIPHGWENRTSDPVVTLWATTPPILL